MIQRTPLVLALLTSATMHVAILLALAPRVPPGISGIPDTNMRVSLMAPSTSVPEVQTTKFHATAQPKDSTYLRDATPRNGQVSAATRPVATAASSGAPPDASTRDLDAATITAHSLQAMLHEALVAHFHYPPLARQNGWQGEVRLGLRIEPNGALAHIHIITSSGYGILDRAALRSLAAVYRLPHAAALLNGSGFNLILPVRYQLLDS